MLILRLLTLVFVIGLTIHLYVARRNGGIRDRFCDGFQVGQQIRLADLAERTLEEGMDRFSFYITPGDASTAVFLMAPAENSEQRAGAIRRLASVDAKGATGTANAVIGFPVTYFCILQLESGRITELKQNQLD